MAVGGDYSVDDTQYGPNSPETSSPTRIQAIDDGCSTAACGGGNGTCVTLIPSCYAIAEEKEYREEKKGPAHSRQRK